MRIGLDGLPLTEPKTGVGHYTFELARALAGLKPSSLLELVYPSTYPLINPVADEGGVALRDNLEVNRVPVGALGRHWWSAGLPRYIRSRKLDLFHGTNYDVPMWRQCATVLTIHDLSHRLHPETHEKRSVSRARRRLPVMARTANAIITPTESVRREVCELMKISSEKVFAIPEAPRACFRPMGFAETEAVRRRVGVGDDFLLTVGTLEPRKNLSVPVSAFAEVARALPQRNLKLVIAGGRGWLSGPLFAAIERSPVRERILLTDYLHDEDLRALYASCRAFIYPSLYEGFGLPPLEAMACGAPVIVSRISALMETTGDAAWHFDPQNVGDLAQRIIELVEDDNGGDGENLRRRLSIVGQRRAAEFSWENTARLTWNVYEEAWRRFSQNRER
jgi:glycosyltransferase involved in cell wall biosynthesis